MLCIAYFIILSSHNIKKMFCKNSIAFGKSTL